MKVEAWAIGKTSEPYLEKGLAIFEKRLKNYLPFQWVALPDARLKTTDGALLKREEAKLVLAKLGRDDCLILLDENGAIFTSPELAHWLDKRLAASHRRLIFLVGGAFGFAPEIYARANFQLSLSRLTFSHQMARLFLLEQLYRAMTILRNEPYHNGS